mmetsp:Transcript_25595/g.63501  ORF Transcript_25595/g.63501 Transcript_25595/m.63501 type:complete len:210 (-) Transcript_25595:206-835(-)
MCGCCWTSRSRVPSLCASGGSCICSSSIAAAAAASCAARSSSAWREASVMASASCCENANFPKNMQMSSFSAAHSSRPLMGIGSWLSGTASAHHLATCSSVTSCRHPCVRAVTAWDAVRISIAKSIASRPPRLFQSNIARHRRVRSATDMCRLVSSRPVATDRPLTAPDTHPGSYKVNKLLTSTRCWLPRTESILHLVSLKEPSSLSAT